MLFCRMLQGSSGATSFYILRLNNSDQPLGTMPERQMQGCASVLSDVRYIREEFHNVAPQLVRRVCTLRLLMESFQSARWLLTSRKT